MNIPVFDPFGATTDRAMPSLALALNPAEAQRQLQDRLVFPSRQRPLIELRAIRVTRYKPLRRCVVEYDVEWGRPRLGSEIVTVLGKVRVHRFGKSGHRLLSALWRAGFQADSPDGISVPEPLGTVSRFQMWLQRKVPGQPSAKLLPGPDGVALARRIAEAAHKLHRAGVPSERRHTMADELSILHQRLASVAAEQPRWQGPIARLLEACDRVGAATPQPTLGGIHRDFYPDQVLVDGERLYLVDFDLYCEGDPGLDIGNFLGHLTEQSLRTSGDPTALDHVGAAMQERFVRLSGEATRPAVRAYAALTLARHVHLSTQFPERRRLTEQLLDICEQRFDTLAAGTVSGMAIASPQLVETKC